MSRYIFSIGLFLITASTLMLPLIQTRILSVVAWYHLAFFVISMAMFGLTVGAVWVYLRRDRFTEKTLSYDLSYFSKAFAVTTALCLSPAFRGDIGGFNVNAYITNRKLRSHISLIL